VFDVLIDADSLLLEDGPWAVAAAILAGLLVLAVVWSYLLRTQLSAWRSVAMLCKLLAVVALAFCLLDPLIRVERPRPGENIFAVLADNSQSMTIGLANDSRPRSERLKPLLATTSPWQTRVAQDFEMRRYAFAERIRPVDELESLGFDGLGSNLSESIATLQERFANRPVAGVLLFSDGIIDQASQARLTDELDFDFPIFPVIEGESGEIRDIAIEDASVSVSSFELAPATVDATIRADGFKGRSITVRLMTQEGKTLNQETLSSDHDAFRKRVRFTFQPPDTGVQFVRLRAMLSSEDSDELDIESKREITTANNTRQLVVNRPGGPFRILYVSGRPNWEFKFLRRALNEDVEVELTGLVRIAKEEPKFSFRDLSVESTNPLMAGFSDNAETTEQYDEPVLLRLGVESGERLKSGFPGSEEELFHYHGLILDDVEASFFTQQQMLLIRKFVADRGGGLMMLGGPESFFHGGFADTPVADILPVYLRRERSRGDAGSVRYRLTREGQLEPWLRLRDTQREEAGRVTEMPEFRLWNPIQATKPGASVLATLEASMGTTPGVVAQRFGEGRSLALLIGDMWRWSMRRESPETDDLAQTWRQMARWLTNDARRRVAIEITEGESFSRNHRITVTINDAGFHLLDNASVELQISKPDGEQVTLTAVADSAHSGRYVSEYWSDLSGGYVCEVRAKAPDGSDLPAVRGGWTSQPEAVEFAQVQPERDFLRRLAERSGGEVIAPDELNDFANSLSSRPVPITETRYEPLWHRPGLITLAVGLLCAEWLIRRWKGLP
jgi:uncharacterized membrane protein